MTKDPMTYALIEKMKFLDLCYCPFHFIHKS